MDPAQAAAIAEAAVATLTASPPLQRAGSGSSSPTAAAAAAAAARRSPKAGGSPKSGGSPTAAAAAPAESGFHYVVGGATAPGLASCMALAAGFAPPDAGQRGRVRLGLALRSNVPADLPVTHVMVRLCPPFMSARVSATSAGQEIAEQVCLLAMRQRQAPNSLFPLLNSKAAAVVGGDARCHSCCTPELQANPKP